MVVFIFCCGIYIRYSNVGATTDLAKMSMIVQMNADRWQAFL